MLHLKSKCWNQKLECLNTDSNAQLLLLLQGQVLACLIMDFYWADWVWPKPKFVIIPSALQPLTHLPQGERYRLVTSYIAFKIKMLNVWILIMLLQEQVLVCLIWISINQIEYGQHYISMPVQRRKLWAECACFATTMASLAKIAIICWVESSMIKDRAQVVNFFL